MKLQKLLSLLRQAIDQYHMIEAEDHIAIGISGGKDSLTLLYGLASLQKFYPIPFTLSAITVDLGLEPMNLRPIQELCSSFSYSLRGCDHRDWKNPLRHPQRNKSMLSLRKDEKRRAKPESHGTWMQ